MKKLRQPDRIPANSVFKITIAYMEYMFAEKQNQQQAKSCQSQNKEPLK